LDLGEIFGYGNPYLTSSALKNRKCVKCVKKVSLCKRALKEEVNEIIEWELKQLKSWNCPTPIGTTPISI